MGKHTVLDSLKFALRKALKLVDSKAPSLYKQLQRAPNESGASTERRKGAGQCVGKGSERAKVEYRRPPLIQLEEFAVSFPAWYSECNLTKHAIESSLTEFNFPIY